MGTACAIVLAEKPDQNVTIWARNPDFAEAMSRDRENARLLPGIPIPDSSPSETSVRLADRASQSSSTPSVLTPRWAPLRASSRTSAVWSIVLAGMQA